MKVPSLLLHVCMYVQLIPVPVLCRYRTVGMHRMMYHTYRHVTKFRPLRIGAEIGMPGRRARRLTLTLLPPVITVIILLEGSVDRPRKVPSVSPTNSESGSDGVDTLPTTIQDADNCSPRLPLPDRDRWDGW
jgi:hypothetical protein